MVVYHPFGGNRNHLSPLVERMKIVLYIPSIGYHLTGDKVYNYFESDSSGSTTGYWPFVYASVFTNWGTRDSGQRDSSRILKRA